MIRLRSNLFFQGILSPTNRHLINRSCRIMIPSQKSILISREFTSSTFKNEKESTTNQAERTMQRFWKTVSLVESPNDSFFTIHLDKRPLKTPDGKMIQIPNNRKLFATLIAQEWNEQTKTLKSHTLPMTSLAARAIDGCSDSKEKQKICSDLLKYLETDTICYHENEPPTLVELQNLHWIPLLEYLNKRYNLNIQPFTSLFGNDLSSSSSSNMKQTFSNLLDQLSNFDLAAFERSVLTTKSFFISVALLNGHLSVEEAARATEVEVQSQINRWGQVEDSHDVEHADLRKFLGSVACAVVRN